MEKGSLVDLIQMNLEDPSDDVSITLYTQKIPRLVRYFESMTLRN